jgi:hypothetical protein
MNILNDTVFCVTGFLIRRSSPLISRLADNAAYIFRTLANLGVSFQVSGGISSLSSRHCAQNLGLADARARSLENRYV